MSDTCDKIGHGPVDTSGFDAVKKSDCAVCQIEAKDQRIAELERDLALLRPVCSADSGGLLHGLICPTCKGHGLVSEDTRKEASSEKA